MINYQYKVGRVRAEIKRKKRKEKLQIAGAFIILFVMYVTVSTMEYNDCINLGVC